MVRNSLVRSCIDVTMLVNVGVEREKSSPGLLSQVSPLLVQ